MNDRVKGYLKITRAFGAGFLKQVFHISKSFRQLECKRNIVCLETIEKANGDFS